MSYRTWTVYGFGVNVSNIETTPEKIIKLAEKAPDVLKDLRAYLGSRCGDHYKDKDLSLDDFEEYEGDFYLDSGLTHVLFEVMNGLFGNLFEIAEDFDGNKFILFTPKFPWEMTREEKNFDSGDVAGMFAKCVGVLTDEPVVDFYDVECGG